jgi:hypothetical protein
MAGFFDYLLGREEYAPDAPIDPNTGLRPADRRQAALQALGNFSAVLSQVGAARNPAEAARAWGAMPQAVGASQTYLDELSKQRRVQAQERGLRDLMQNPEQLKSLGLNANQIGLMKFLPTDAAAAFVAKAASADPLKAQQAQALEDLISQLPPNQQLLARAAPQAFVTQILAAQKPESASADIKNYNFYKAEELAANRAPLSFNEWRLLNKKAGATQVLLPGEKSPADAALREAMAKEEGKRLSEALTVADVSGASLNDFQILEEAIAGGPESLAGRKLTSMFPELDSRSAIFESIVKRIAPTLRAPGSGSTSDIEYAGMLKGLPQLINKPEANMAILQAMKAKAQINVERGEIITKYANNEITPAEMRKSLSALNRRSIINSDLRKALNAAIPVAGAKSEDDLINKYKR